MNFPYLVNGTITDVDESNPSGAKMEINNVILDLYNNIS